MSDRCTLLQQINEISFVVNDLNLYLDKAGMDFFKNISTNCTNAAITRMNTIVCK